MGAAELFCRAWQFLAAIYALCRRGRKEVSQNLRAALKSAGFEIGDSPVKAHLVLDEFTSGSTAKRVMVGFGAGRSSVDTRLVVVDGEKEAASVRIRVRGNLIFSPYEGGNTQRRQAVNSFQQRMLEEIYKLK